MTPPTAPQAEPPSLQAASMRLSVIIVNWNTYDFLKACLDSLKSTLENPDCEVIVVDNASSDGSSEMVVREYPRATLIQMMSNGGFSSGNNAGIRVARGRYIVLLNSDTEVRDDALGMMCDYMDKKPRIGALGARLLNLDGSIQMSCRSFPSYRTALFHRKSLLTRLFPGNRYSQQYLMTAFNRDEPVEVDWVIGACLMTRRETIDEVGLLDDGFFMYAEDVDWCFRMQEAGWTVEYFPQARVMHHYEKSAAKAPFRMTYERHRSMWRFYKKHYSRDIVLLDLATIIGIGGRFGMMIVRDAFRSSGREKS